MKIPGYGRQNGEKRNFFCLYLQCAVVSTSRLIKINKIRIQAVVNIINTEYPAAMNFLFILCVGV